MNIGKRRVGPASRWYPWLLLGLLWSVSFLNQANRSILVATMPAIRAEFGLSATQLALLNSLFLWTYAAAAIFAGWLGDRMSRSRVIILGLIAWSIATGLMPLASSFAILLSLRALIGLCEASYYPSGTALIGDWFKPTMRSRALSLHQTAVFAGSGIGAVVAAAIADRFGWRAPFLLFGVLGLPLALALVAYLRDGPVAAEKTLSNSRPFRTVLHITPALYLCGVFFFANAASTGVMVWAPTFVHDALGLNLTGSALYGAAPLYVAGFLVVPIGGFWGDWLIMRTPLGRIYVLAFGLIIAALFLLPLSFAGSGMMVALILLVGSAGKGLFDGCIYAAMQDVVPAEARASAVGLMTAIGFAGAGLAPLMVAQVAGVFGMAAGLTSLALLYVAAVGILVASLRSTRKAILSTAPQPS